MKNTRPIYWNISLAIFVTLSALLFNGCSSGKGEEMNGVHMENKYASNYIGRWVVVDAFVHDDILLENFKHPYKSGDQEQVEELVWDIETAFIGRVYDLRPDGSCVVYSAGDSMVTEWEYIELRDGEERQIFFKAENEKHFEAWDLYTFDYGDSAGCCIETRITTIFDLYPMVLSCDRADEIIIRYYGFDRLDLEVKGGMEVYADLGQGLYMDGVLDFIRVEFKKESAVSSISEVKKQHRHRNLAPTLNSAMFNNSSDYRPEF